MVNIFGNNNSPLIEEGRIYSSSKDFINKKVKDQAKITPQAKQSTPQQTPEEQQQQHILNINYLISLFNNQERI